MHEKAFFLSYRPFFLTEISDKADQCSMLSRTHPYISVLLLSDTIHIYLLLSTQLPIFNITVLRSMCITSSGIMDIFKASLLEPLIAAQ